MSSIAHSTGGDIVIGARQRDGAPVAVPAADLARHTLVFGGSGGGKSYFSYLMIREQLKRGCSLVAVDPKMETIRRLRGACHEAGIAPERVAVISGLDPEAAPGLNPFLAGGDPAQMAADVLDLFRRTGAMTGDRMATFLTHAVRLAAWHGLGVKLLPRLLYDDALRASILRRPPLHPADELYRETAYYFTKRFTAYGEKEREGSALSVETKFTTLLGSRLFLRMLNASRNTVDFDSLFRGQGAVLVHFGKGGGVTEEAGLLLAAVAIHLLEAASIRRPGPRPVVLAVDEFRKLSGFLEESLQDVANLARERNLRLLLATQHPGQIPPGLRADVLESSAVKAYFRPGPNSIEQTARFLDGYGDAAGATADHPETPAAVARYQGRLLSRRRGRELEGLIPVQAEIAPPSEPLVVDPGNPGGTLKRFLRFAPSTIPPVYLEDGRRASGVLAGLPEGAAALSWRGGFAHVRIDPPGEAAAAAATPGWEARLRALGTGQAVVIVGAEPPEEVRVTRVDPPADAPEAYVARSRRASRVPPDALPPDEGFLENEWFGEPADPAERFGDPEAKPRGVAAPGPKTKRPAAATVEELPDDGSID